MKILFCGDLVGRTGRQAIIDHLPKLQNALSPDFVIVNGENAAHGFGITKKITEELFDNGVDVITTGNHIWDQKDILRTIDKEPRLLRPLNLAPTLPGAGFNVYENQRGKRIMVINAMGRLFMEYVDDPFKAIDEVIKKYPMGDQINAIFVDYHAEATSEKTAIAFHLDGRVSAVVGTHTHVPTSDARILPKGTAYQTDAGMTGDYISVIGMKHEASVNRFLRKVPSERFTPAEGQASLCGIFVETDDETGLATSISQIQVGGALEQRLPPSVTL